MKISALLFIFFICSFARSTPQDAEPKDAASIIVNAKFALGKVNSLNRELEHLSEPPIGTESREKLHQHMQDLAQKRKELLSTISRAAELPKVDTPIFSYPGLLALGPIKFHSESQTYTLMLLVGYSSYELGPALHPIYRNIEFDLAGKIKEIKVFDSSKAWEN